MDTRGFICMISSWSPLFPASLEIDLPVVELLANKETEYD
jgi:hypothetical protein